jgi:hypothetical protein
MSQEPSTPDRDQRYDGEWVEVRSGFDPDVAVLLLDAAEQANMPVEWVRTTSEGFLVPQDVADAAGVDYEQNEPEAGTLDAVQAEQAEQQTGDERPPGVYGDETGGQDLSFATRSEASTYAAEHNINIEGGDQMSAADYKAAVAAAAKGA